MAFGRMGVGAGFGRLGARAHGGVSGPVGGAALLANETDGFATDFTYPVDAQRVAVKVAGVVTSYGLDSFYLTSGGSPKLVYDVNGNLVWSPHNMCLQSQTLDQATPWGPTGLTISANAIVAPDGTLTADRLVETATTNNHQLTSATVTQIVGETYTISFYAKAGERNWLSVLPNNTTIANWFDIGAGVLGTVAASCTINSAGNGWYFCTLTYVNAAPGGPTFHVRTANGQVSTYLGDVTKGLYIWGVQLNRGPVPTAYLPTTTVIRNGLAIDYDPVTHAPLGLRTEPAATNLLLNNAVLSTQSVTVTAVAHTLSFFGTGTVTLSGVSTAGPLTGTGVGNRVSLTFTPTAGSLTLTVSGSVTNAQLETGTVPTSVIPTFAATATRSLDTFNVTPASINYSATVGSWWADMAQISNPGSASFIQSAAGAGILSGSTTNLTIFDGSTLSKGVGVSVFGNPIKGIVAWDAAGHAITGQGLTPSTDVVAPGATITTPGAAIYIGGSGGNVSNGYIRKLTYRARRVSNANMQTETA